MAADAAPALVSLDGTRHRVFNEAAFRYFFEVERARAAQARWPSLLLLVRVPRGGRGNGRVQPRAVSKTFAAITGCVRDADVVGWYCEGSIAGAVLTGTGPLSSSTRTALCARVGQTLRQSLPSVRCTGVSTHVVVLGRPSRP